jgi:Mg2+/citrate symporter
MSLISTVVLILLVAAWGWVLGRPLLQSMLNRSHRDPVGHFNRQLSVLGQAPRHSATLGSSSIIAPSRNAMKRRRLQWFMAFVMAAVVSLVLAVAFRGVFVWQHLLIDGLLVAYVALAARMGAMERERSAKVTSLRVVGQNPGSSSYLRAVGER